MTSETSNWFSKTGWSKNPFALEIRPELFVGCAGIISELESGMSAGQKYAVVLGPTGAGKTTLLKKLAMQSPCFYLPKPPATKDELLSVFSQIYFGTGITRKLFGPRDVSLYNFSENANKKYKGKPPILLIDEANESDIDVLEWFRALIDQIEGQSAIFAGLPSFKSTHLDKLETLSQRVTISINMNSLTKDEIFELIRKRIESVGGRGVDPFTSDTIFKIYSKTGGFPREVIKICNSLVLKASTRDAAIIDISYLDGAEHTNFDADEIMSTLTQKQVHLLEILSKEPLTPTDIVSKADLPEYKTKAHALRGVNNMLRRLEAANLVCREKKGKRYKYALEPKIKTVLVKA